MGSNCELTMNPLILYHGKIFYEQFNETAGIDMTLSECTILFKIPLIRDYYHFVTTHDE